MKNDAELAMDIQRKIDESLEKAISFLAKSQLKNGSFTCLVSQANYGLNEEMENFENGDRKGWVSIDNLTVFPTTLIGFSLLHLNKYKEANHILQKIDSFLLKQKKGFDIWNHYQRNSPVHKYLPNDVDDTCCALAYLKMRNNFKGEHDDIILANRNEHGLFYTWFCFRKKWNKSLKYWIAASKECRHPMLTYKHWNESEGSRYDVDAVVNANVVYYLGDRKETIPAIEYIIQEIKKGNEAVFDGYYKNPFAIYYFISKCIAAGIKAFEPISDILKERLIAHINSDGGIRDNALDTSLGLCSLLNINYVENDRLIQAMRDYILNKQLSSGAWPKRVLYSGGVEFVYGWGSEELCTAIAAEALHRSSLTTSNEKRDNHV